jgi:hypothetical protein
VRGPRPGFRRCPEPRGSPREENCFVSAHAGDNPSRQAPTAKLEVLGTISASNVYVTATTGTVSATNGYFKNISATSYSGNGSGLTGVNASPAGPSGSIQFNLGGVSTSGTAAFVINNNNVGIGTTAPSTTLDVVKSTGSQVHFSTGPAGTGGGGYLISNAQGQAMLSGGAEFTGASVIDANGWTARGGATSAAVWARGGILYFMTNAGLTDGSTFTPTPRMTIDISGNVGIGTTAPALLLHIDQNTASGAPDANPGQLLLKGYAGSSKAYSGIRFAMHEHTTGWGADILGFDDTALYGGAMTFRTGTGSATGTPTERMRISSAGNVGIGTSAPGTRLEANGTAANPPTSGATSGGVFRMRAVNNVVDMGAVAAGNGLWIQAGDATALGVNYSLALNPNGGNVGIGTTTPAYPLDISATTGILRVQTNNYADLILDGAVGSTGLESAVLFQENHVNKFELYRTNSNNFSLYDFARVSTAFTWITAPGSFYLTVYGSTATCSIGNATGAVTCTSDIRLKKDIAPIPNSLEKLLQLKGVTFHWKNPERAGPEHIGVIAQDVEKVFPQAVTEISDTTPGLGGSSKAVDIAALVAPVIEALRELKGMFDTNHSAIQELRQQNDDLQRRLDAIERRLSVLSPSPTLH